MRVRTLSASGDMLFGQSAANFSVDTPAAVAQCVKTRLLLWTGEWFQNLNAGTPYLQQVIGKGTASQYDAVFKSVILNTPGVIGIENYSSVYDNKTRSLAITATINTQYGVFESLNTALPPAPSGLFSPITDDSGTVITDDAGMGFDPI